MDEAVRRLLLLLNLLVPLVLFMACVYLALHMVFARLIASPASPVLWFFSVVTGPLTRPVRRFLAPATPEPRVRAVALGVYAALWMGARLVLARLVAAGPE